MFSSCHQKPHTHDQTIEESTHHKAETQSFTELGDHYDFFVEYEELLAGQKAEFISHFTRLDGYKPVSKGILEVEMYNKDASYSGLANRLERPGIFIPEIIPEKPGVYDIVFRLITNNDSIIFTINDIHVEDPDSRDEAHQHEHAEEPATLIRYTKEQAWKTEFGLLKIIPASFNEVIKTSGELLNAPESLSKIVCTVNGVVHFSQNLLAGSRINKGDELFWIEGTGYSDSNPEIQYQHIKSDYETAKTNFDRLEKLYNQKIVTEEKYLEAKKKYEESYSHYQALMQKNLKKQKLFATNNTTILNVLVSEGDFITPGQVLLETGDDSKMMLRADVSQNHFHCLNDIQSANFMTPYNNKVYEGKDLNCSLLSFGKKANNAGWSVPVFFSIDADPKIIPGTYVEVYLLSAPIPNVIAIPESALVEEQGNFYVFVQHSGESYEKRQVKTGLSNGKDLEITSGLEPGEIIVSKGAYQLKLASLSGSLPVHNHNH